MTNRCILVVDSDERVRSFVREVLQERQIAVIDYADPEAAIDALPGFRDDLSAIVSDTGFASKLARKLPHVPILMISGSNEPPVEDPGLCFLGKPFGPRTLMRALTGLTRAAHQLA
jgi:CheY-like chemotaxis protein